MTKTQLVQTLADSCEITKKEARNLLDTLAHTAVSEVKNIGVFVLPGIGRLIRIDPKLDAPVDAPPDGSRTRVAEIEVPPPKSARKSPKKATGPRTGAKTDWLVTDAANRALGVQGEKFVFDLERHHLNAIGRANLAAKVEWTARDRGDGLGYDIRSFDDAGGDHARERAGRTARQPYRIGGSSDARAHGIAGERVRGAFAAQEQGAGGGTVVAQAGRTEGPAT